MRTLHLAVVAALLALAAEAAAVPPWRARIEGVESIDDRLQQVASDAAGDLIVADDGGVAKYARAGGARLWRTRVIDAVDTVNFLGGVTVDASGDVVVTGSVAKPGMLRDALAVKLSGVDGRVLWRFEFDGPGQSADYATRATTDANGDVIFGGTSHLIAEDMLAVKLDGRTGAKKWHAVVPGPGVGQDQGLAVAVAANGDVAVAGDSTIAGTNRFAVIKLSGTDGKLLWRAAAGGASDNGQATAVAFDGAGDVFVTGSIAFAGTGFDVAVVKLDGATGAERWHRYADGSAHAFDFAADLAVDATGGVVVVGHVVNDGTREDLLVWRLASDGAEAWRREIDGGQSAHDDGNAVAVVGQRVVVAAAIDGERFDATDFAALGLDLATGAEVWRHVRSGDAGGRDQATSIAPGASGAVYVAGRLANRGTKDDGLVLELDAASGVKHADLAINRAVPDDDAAHAVAVDASGDVVAVGTVGTRQTRADITVVKLGGASGGETWRTRIDGAMHLDDAGGPVVLDSAGDVIAAGTTVDGPPLPSNDPRLPGLPPLTNVTIVKLDGATGAEQWRSAPAFGGRGIQPAATDLALAGTDVVVAGWFGTLDFDSRSAVVKLRGDDGAELWRSLYFFSLFPEEPVEVEVDGAGDVVVASGSLVDKLRGADGVKLWGPLFGSLFTADLVLDAQGDVVLAGASGFGFAVEKRRGTDGSSAWSARLGLGRALAVAVDAAGDVLVAGALEVEFEERLAVFKLAGASGATLWSRVAPGRQPARGLALVVDAAGDVLVGGVAGTPGRGEDLSVLKLRAENGRIRWRRLIDEGSRLDDRAQAIALQPGGHPVAAGVLSGADSGEDFAVLRLDGRTGRYR